MPGEISRSYEGPGDWPYWVEEAAKEIVENLRDWEASAAQSAQQEQDSQAYTDEMIAAVSDAILKSWRDNSL